MTQKINAPSNSAGIWDNTSIWLKIGFILIIALLLRLPNLGESLWFDELFSTAFFMDDFEGLKKLINKDLHPPLNYILWYYWNSVFGDSEISIRILSVLFGLGSVALTYFLAARFTSKNNALLASLLLAISPVHIWYSQEPGKYSPFIFLTLATVYFFERAWFDSSSKRLWLMYFLSATLLLLLHFYGGLIILGTTIIALFTITKRKRLLILLLINILVFVLFAFLLWNKKFVISSGYIQYLRNFTFFEWWMLFLNWFPMANSLFPLNPYSMNFAKVLSNPLQLVLQIFYLVLIIAGIYSFLKERGKRHFLLYLFITPIFFIIASYFFEFTGKNFLERSFINIFPFYLIVLVKCLDSNLNFINKKIIVPILISISLVVLAFYFIRNNEWTVYKPNPDWRAMAEIVDSQDPQSNGRILIFHTSDSRALKYYTKVPYFRYISHRASLNDINKVIAKRGLNRFYILSNDNWNPIPEEALRRQFKNNSDDWYIDKTYKTKGLNLYRIKTK